jgi:hypothetical protein
MAEREASRLQPARRDQQPAVRVVQNHLAVRYHQRPFLVTSWQDESPHDDVATWSIEASSAGLVDVRDVGAVINITSQPQNRTITTGSTLTLTQRRP